MLLEIEACLGQYENSFLEVFSANFRHEYMPENTIFRGLWSSIGSIIMASGLFGSFLPGAPIIRLQNYGSIAHPNQKIMQQILASFKGKALI